MPIFDQGYQHWTGPLSGHAWRWLAVARHGVRATLKSRLVRWFLFAAWAPALALVAVLAVWGLLEQQAESVLTVLKQILPAEMVAQPREFRSAVWTIAYSFFFKAELAMALFLVLVVGPNLVSRDLRFNALPLYFSRPLRRIDYFVGKLGVIGFFLAVTQVGPAVVAYLFGIAFSLDVGVIRDTHRLLWGGALYGLVITLSAGTLMLALSSLSRRSIYVGLAWAGFVLLTGMVSGMLMGVHIAMVHQQTMGNGMEGWVKDHPPPAGVRMYGSWPSIRYEMPKPGDKGGGRMVPERDPATHPAPFTAAEEKAARRWYDDWTAARNRLRDDATATLAAESRTDWRAVVSYSNNLGRMGDLLLGTDAAWVTIGQAVERPRAAFGPMANLQAGGRLPRELTGPANDRRLADQFVWQYPWTWSAGVLGGLWLLSLAVLTTRVKSLDRLK
jgi:ABC-type transport system involved in multi-copper enzyme maturation permease subunit